MICLSCFLVLASGAFAAKKSKVEAFKFDFSKDFFPGITYVAVTSKAFNECHLTKADIMKNVYEIENVKTTASLVPITLTLKVALSDDGTLSYEYSDLRYVKDGSSLEMTKLVAVSPITQSFDSLLPDFFADEALYDKMKSECLSSPGFLYAATKGLTEIRAGKFSEIVTGAQIKIKAKVTEAKMNDNESYTDYRYRISAYVQVGVLTKNVYFTYYTNDDDKAGSAGGDDIEIEGQIRKFAQSRYSPATGLCFEVAE